MSMYTSLRLAHGRGAIVSYVCILALAGCQTNWPAWTKPQTSASQRTIVQVKLPPATQPQHPPIASQPATDDSPAAQLTHEVQQYVNNLPTDDLQAKLARHEGLPTGSDAADSPKPSSLPDSQSPASDSELSTFDSRPPVGDVRPRHVPLPPQIILPTGQAPDAPNAEPQNTSRSSQPPIPNSRLTAHDQHSTSHDSQIVEIAISPAALASLPSSPATPVAKPGTNRPAAVKPGPSDELKQLIDQLRTQAADRPDSVGAALRLRLAEWSLGSDTAPEDWTLQDTDKRRLAQSVWQVLQVVSKLEASPQGAPPADFQKAIESLEETLQQVQPLQIPTALLCRSVSSFGCPDALPEPWQFPAGRTSMVVLYCELTGFKTQPAADRPGWCHTLFSQRLAILTTAGKELWSYEDQQVEDFCLHPRRDFFITKLLKIPPELPPSDYVLKVTIRDKIANRVTETNLPFAITAANSPQ